MSSIKTMAMTAPAPAPDDSDFLDSESERGFEDSTVEQEVESFTQSAITSSQRCSPHSRHQMTDMEAELDAVATPCTSQTTSTPYFARRTHPKPAVKIMQMTEKFSFTFFDHPAPSADILNQGQGRQAARLPVNEEEQVQFCTRVRQEEAAGKEPQPASSIAPHLAADTIIHWFSIDSELVYLSFFDDWGPLNVAMFYRFCLHLHHLIGMMQEKATAQTEKGSTPSDIHLILYTTSQPRSKANAALLAAMYAMVCGDMTPADAFFPLSELELVPFRDAGYGRADFYLTVQDILYGVHRAISEKLLDLMSFDLDEYETYEQVQNGDWNWITPNIIAFASPNDKEYVAELRAGAVANGRATPGLRRPLNPTFTKLLQYFRSKNVKLVVRLNNPLYDSRVFEREGIQHIDMYFDDGSNPSEEILRNFIQRANEVISEGGAIAVHCKAGLGRTGVLIGAYLAYKHGFSAAESIGFMRIMRPGCVVGPQQHFMYKEAPTWIRWREQDDARRVLDRALAQQKAELSTTSSRRRKSDEMEDGQSSDNTDAEVDAALQQTDGRQVKRMKKSLEDPCTPKKVTSSTDDREEETAAAPALLVKPTPCVGQPRKSPSPSQKRAAQARAPATVARMGGFGNSIISTGRGRVISSNHRSFSGSSFTRNLQQAGLVRESAEEQENVVQQGPGAPVTPSGSRVLGEAQRLNMQTITVEESEVALSTPRADQWNAAHQAKASITDKSKGEAGAVDNGLFTEGWKSPEPPTTYSDLLGRSPSRNVQAVLLAAAAPSTPTSPSKTAPSVRASPHIREKFGLREAGSHPGTPRSRKETASLHSSDSRGSGSSSSSSLTSQDAPGSEEEDPKIFRAKALPAAVVHASKSILPVQTANANMYKSTVVVQPRSAVSSTQQRIASRDRTTPAIALSTTTTTTKQRAVSSASTTSSRSASGQSRPASVAARRQPLASSKAANVGAATSSGRVAAARDLLAQRQATVSQNAGVAHRSSLKRPRVLSPDLGSIAPTQKGVATSSTMTASRHGTNGTAATVSYSQNRAAVVPRFAAATAASAAKSQHLFSDHPTHIVERGGPVQSISTRFAAAVPSAASARLNGRNVRRRRSSIS